MTTTPITVRDATAADVEAVAALHVGGWRDAYAPALSPAFLAGPIVEDRRRVWTARLGAPPPDQRVLLACEGEAVLGFACLVLGADPAWGSLLDNLHVRREHRGRRVGATLLREVARRCAREAPTVGLYLWVLRINEAAQRFYARHGALPRGEDVWHAPEGSAVPVHRYAWPAGGWPGSPLDGG